MHTHAHKHTGKENGRLLLKLESGKSNIMADASFPSGRQIVVFRIVYKENAAFTRRKSYLSGSIY